MMTDTPAGKLTPYSEPTPRNIQAALLQTAGPITIHLVVRSNFTFLKNIGVIQFLDAAYSLQALGLGTVVTVKNRFKVFIKKPPDEARLILEANPDLCCPEYYAYRYSQALSKTVPLDVRSQVAAMKLVSAKQMM